MMTWPWTNTQKELQKRLKELENPDTLKSCLPVEDVFAMIRNRPPLKWHQKLWNKIHFTTYDSVWYVYRLFKPCHQKVRNTIPRQWSDLVELIRDVNFAFIVEFYEDEYRKESFADPDNDEAQKVAEFLETSYKYIKEERELLQNKISLELDLVWRVDNKEQRSKTYADIFVLEKELESRDTEVLVKLMQYRAWMWS